MIVLSSHCRYITLLTGGMSGDKPNITSSSYGGLRRTDRHVWVRDDPFVAVRQASRVVQV